LKKKHPGQNLRATACALLNLALAGASRQAQARPVSFVHRTLLCQSLIVTSDTALSSTNLDPHAQGLSQAIRLTDMSRQRTIVLPIFQNFSPNKNLHGKKVLDGLVWAFECGAGPSGQPYVKLLWSCTNPDAATCSPAEDVDDEWRALYDSSGHHLPAEPRYLTSSDKRKIGHLGLWHFLMHDGLHRNGGFTYFYKQVEPNGHIR
jgi:hypothetical protein